MFDEQQPVGGNFALEWPGNAPFAACLTHDVDNVSRHATRIAARRLVRQIQILGHAKDRRALRTTRATLVAMLRSLRHWRRPDPLHCYEHWLQMEQQVGAKSTFLFLPHRYRLRHYSDAGYRHDDRIRFDGRACTVAEMMRQIHHSGWEVGLHASWQTCDSPAEMIRQKEQVQDAIDDDVVSVRHHNLHFDIRSTPRVHEQAGLRVDSSLGFNDALGFRTGTSHPYRLQDLATRQMLEVIELPLVIQDKCLLAAGEGTIDGAIEEADSLIRQVARAGGVLTVLWHPGVITSPLLTELYSQLLQLLRERGAWFGTMKEIAQWWEEKQRVADAA